VSCACVTFADPAPARSHARRRFAIVAAGKRQFFVHHQADPAIDLRGEPRRLRKIGWQAAFSGTAPAIPWSPQSRTSRGRGSPRGAADIKTASSSVFRQHPPRRCEMVARGCQIPLARPLGNFSPRGIRKPLPNARLVCKFSPADQNDGGSPWPAPIRPTRNGLFMDARWISNCRNGLHRETKSSRSRDYCQ